MSGGSKSGPSRRRGGGPLPGTEEARGGTRPGASDPTPAGPGEGPAGAGGGAGAPDLDPCDLSVEADLVGVRPKVAARVAVGDSLDVVLETSDGFEAAVCRTRPDGAFLGSLAAVEGLDRLLRCLRDGRRYAARILDVGSARCRVAVRRLAP